MIFSPRNNLSRCYRKWTRKKLYNKSHHNVGGLPEHVDFKEIIEPLRDLFKDEVRKVGLELGIPEYLVFRQPFPGPGLAIRVIGDITDDKLDILKKKQMLFLEKKLLMQAYTDQLINILQFLQI